ncbi:GMC oxidoreductase [Nesterenkonia sp. CL21]|uniref:GMC oxidoreductase n=1 Tax=Nesterenkonia sp. CL21 TaxID=3064894 RepID=UPI00287A65F1|nr:GMC oxidoreductase [Nesterenkonia sp. CL21]MDS2173443.1 GMC oxidoreductase [Nesterenkonia sp. CL21]
MKTICIVGSGPIGSAYARTLLESGPDVRVIMLEAGPQLTEVPGESVRNLLDPETKAEARTKSQGPLAGDHRAALGIPEDTVVEGSFTARQGTFLLDYGGEGSAEAAQFPAAAASSNVGGQGAHWTCATPRPADSEKVTFIDDAEWEDLLAAAEELLHVHEDPFDDSPIAAALQTILEGEFADELPEGRGVGKLPVAGDPQEDGTMRWAGADVVLGPLTDASDPLAERFQLRDLTLVREILHGDGRARGVVAQDLRTGEVEEIPADAVVVAADAFRTPQLLWRSGVRPQALGRYLTEHPVVVCTVALDGETMRRYVPEEDRDAELARRARHADPVAAALRIPFSEPDHPYSAQVMYSEQPPFPLPEDSPHRDSPWGFVNMGFGLRKHPRPEDGVSFDDEREDYLGFPRMTIRYELTATEEAEISAATERLRRAGTALGHLVAAPRLMPAGSSLHYQGTTRLGTTDDGTSVADPWSVVWGYDNLVVGGNGVIPTATTMNPTLMSVALAVRGARRLADSLRG